MSKKFRLFASVATPLVALPLMMQTAGATPLKPEMAPTEMPGLIRVQQQIVVPGAESGGQTSGQADGQSQGEGQQRPRRQQSQGDAGQQSAPRGAQSSETEQPTQRPRRQQQAEPDATTRQAPQAEQPAADAPAQRPRRQQQAEDSQGETQQPRRDRQRQQAGSDSEAPAATDTQRTPGGTNSQQRRATESGTTDPSASQAETPATRPRAGERPAASDATPERPARRNTETQSTTPTDGTAQGSRTTGSDATGTPATGAPAARTLGTGNTATGAPATATPGSGTSAPGNATTTSPATTGQQPAGEAPATQQPSRQQAQPVAPTGTQQPAAGTQQPAAGSPAAAGSAEQPVQPGENGAPVFDSAKQAPGAAPEAGQRRQQVQQADQQQLAPPKSDAEAQRGTRATREQQQEFRQLSEERGQRLDARPEFERPRGWDFGGQASGNRNRDRDGGRVIISIDNQPVVRHDDSRRFYDEGGRRPEYERLGGDRVREVIIRDDGTRIVTVRNRYGEIVQRSRVVRGGEEYVLYSAPDLLSEDRGRDYTWRDPGADLPPMRLSVPVENYIIDTSSEPDRDYYEFLEQPPVEQVERVYSLDEVRYSARIRDKVPRIDLDTITFATGSAEIPMNQASSLRKVADAINKVLERDPSETFLIEGHTDAVGADQDNLVLSDERAESVARVLSDAFAIPPENLTTQGYGEQYLKVKTEAPNQENRRVTIRRITPLVKPVASNQ
ncbi:OmpA family protein [Rhizobium deserti]|uniref:OmpA family protein n=1 Tax=Rhizobium deserti TaxID=2547961 RepID=A0A4R5UIZ6_9HYPH|nr:OmpA family protein [Rhizobium deserti]TDK36699.1 OmpA family protein [Rhizobium deserti]